MSRDFLSNFNMLSKQPKTDSDDTSSEEITAHDLLYVAGEYAHCVFFVWPDGKTDFIDYHRLGGGTINTEQTNIRLDFGATVVELTGFRLGELLKSIAFHRRKYVYCDDPRYNDLNTDESVVNEITITQSS